MADDLLADASLTIARPDDQGETMNEVLGTIVPAPGPPSPEDSDQGPSTPSSTPSARGAERTLRRTPPELTGLDEGEVDARIAGAARLEHEVELQGSLGSGGMGIVRLATQTALGRQVAVKSASPAARAAVARRSLLQEAWAAAALEHPNVVPVYTLAVDAQGAPHVVMRRIEGRTWARYLADPAAVQATFGARDTLSWHLGVLQQVCNAIHFAHSRGILHRDIKPDNVMIGRFGEVYVLDWGLAVRLTEDGVVRVPLARTERRVVGTPRFMSPEMVRGDGSLLSARTDVYLLGGLLYTVLTGHGPHLGDGVAETLAAVSRFEAVLPEGTSPRLAAIVRRSMAHEPAARFASAEELRLEVQAYLEERSADALSVEARSRLDQLQAELARPEPERQALYRHFEAARFGFQQARLAWPAHDQAAQGLRQALIAMLRYELAQGDLRAAAVHLSELSDPPPDLLARRAELQALQAADQAEVARLRADRDPALGQRTRAFVFLLVTAAWTLIPLLSWLHQDTPSLTQLLTAHLGMTVVVFGLVVWARDSLSRTALNRRIASMLMVLQIMLVLGDLVAALLGLDGVQVAIMNDLLFATIAAMLLDSVGRLVVWIALAYLAAGVIAAVRPAALLPLNGLANALVFVIAWKMWAPALSWRGHRQA